MLADRSLLLNAWRRVLTSRHYAYRQYQRREIEAFGTSYAPLLAEIYQQLRNETYTPSVPNRIFVPKDTLSDRTLTLLSMPDWVVYTAIATVVAEAVYPKESWRYKNTVFSNLPRIGRTRPIGFFRLWERQYNLYNKTCEAVAGNLPFLLDFDLTSFYDLIDHDLLLTKIRVYVKDVYLLDLLERMLRIWTGDSLQLSFNHGLPQGPEASGFLADLFLFAVDDANSNRSGRTYLRYVDDFRIFASTTRECEIAALQLERDVKRVGLASNASKTRILDTRKTPGWLRQPDYGQFTDDTRRRKLNRRSSLVRLEHMAAKQTFLKHFKRRPASPRDELRVRRSFSRMLPDAEVIGRIIREYPYRSDSWNFIFQYLMDCPSNPQVQKFCWRRLSLPPARDWECANLIEVAIRTRGYSRLTPGQVQLLERYTGDGSLPMASAQATAALLAMGIRRPSARWLSRLSDRACDLAVWLPALLRGRLNRPSKKRSVVAVIRQLMRSSNLKTNFLVSYLAGAKLSKADLTGISAPNPTYSRIVLNTVANLGTPTASDEIAAILVTLFQVRIPTVFDFRVKLRTLDARLYTQALKHLQLAAWYFDTSPTYFVNHIHNFNHVLWHFALRQHGIIPATMKWQHSMGQLTNPAAKKKFPTMAAVFDKCRIARNTNLSSHPMDEKRKRFSRDVSYPERDSIKAQLRAAYREFMVEA